jgi:hypothetical protein
MPIDGKVIARLKQALLDNGEHIARGPRLMDDGRRLHRRIIRFTEMKLVAAGIDLDAVELACFAIQLPCRTAGSTGTSRGARGGIRDRAEEAAELLLSLSLDVDEALLDRTARILHEMPHRQPMLDEAKLLADALNLDDFGVTGLVNQAATAAIQGDGILQLADGLQKREVYGYWEARLKDGFHFEPVRLLARRRLDNARHVALLLSTELKEDGAST